MHPSSLSNMRLVKDKYLQDMSPSSLMLDVGGRGLRADRSYRSVFEGCFSQYYVADILDGLGVTHVMPGPYTLPFADESLDLVVSGQMLEHCGNPFKSVAEMRRVLKVGGRMVLIAPSTGPKHDKRDGWRFLNDAFRFIISDIGGIETIADWIDVTAEDEESKRWRDHVFVGRKVSP